MVLCSGIRVHQAPVRENILIWTFRNKTIAAALRTIEKILKISGNRTQFWLVIIRPARIDTIYIYIEKRVANRHLSLSNWFDHSMAILNQSISYSLIHFRHCTHRKTNQKVLSQFTFTCTIGKVQIDASVSILLYVKDAWKRVRRTETSTWTVIFFPRYKAP